MQRHYQYTYDCYSDDLARLVSKIKNSKEKYTHIVGIVRGGCIPGVHLSNILKIPFSPLTWSHSRMEKERDHTILLNPLNTCLVVDDILDEGSTMNEVTAQYGNIDTAVLIYNSINRFNIVPTYMAWTINREQMPNWFDFWWEK